VRRGAELAGHSARAAPARAPRFPGGGGAGGAGGGRASIGWTVCVGDEIWGVVSSDWSGAGGATLEEKRGRLAAPAKSAESADERLTPEVSSCGATKLGCETGEKLRTMPRQA
jgi:hypothetical protein